MESNHPPLRRLSASTFVADEIDLLMRNSPRQFTEEEVAALAAFDLPDPDEASLQRFATSGAVPPRHAEPDAAGRLSASTGGHTVRAAHLVDYLRNPPEAEEDTKAARPTTAQQRARGARLGDAAVRLPSGSAAAAASAAPIAEGSTGRRLSQQLQRGSLSASAAAKGVDDTKRIFGVLSRQDLVGGPETVAEAILNTTFVDLSGTGLLTTASAECFLNATHVYLQQNLLTDLDGLLLLAQLRVLVVHHNRLTSLTPLAVLDSLMYLDASHNEVERLDAQWDLPCASLQYLNLLGNPCCPMPAEAVVDGATDVPLGSVPGVQEYRCAIESACPQLELLDELPTAVGEAADAEDDEEDEEVPSASASGELVEDLPAASLVEESAPVQGSPRRPVKPFTAPVHPARRSVPRNTACDIASERRASGVATHTSTTSGGGDGTLSRAQKRLRQVRADAVGGASVTKVGSQPATATAKEAQPPAEGDLDAGGEEGADGPSASLKKSLQVKRASLTHGPAMSDNEERLLQQFQAWARHRREAVLATLDQVGAEDVVDGDDTVDEPRHDAYNNSDDAAHMQGKMYLDTEFADKVARDRLERSLQDTWAGVAKVRQTRMAVLAERRRQQREALRDHSQAYKETLSLLKKESFAEDLAPYRAADSSTEPTASQP